MRTHVRKLLLTFLSLAICMQNEGGGGGGGTYGTSLVISDSAYDSNLATSTCRRQYGLHRSKKWALSKPN